MALLTHDELTLWVAGLAFDTGTTPTAAQAADAIETHESRFMASLAALAGIDSDDVVSGGTHEYLYHEGRQIVGKWAAVQLARSRYRRSDKYGELQTEADRSFEKMLRRLSLASGGASPTGQGYGGTFASGATYTPTTTQTAARSLLDEVIDGGEL